MKSDNKKALYESIMAIVAKEVKKALNETSDNFNNGEAYRFLKDNASDIISLTEDAAIMYQNAYNEMSIK